MMMQSNTFKTKSFWTGLAMVVTGIGLCAQGNMPEGIQTIAGGLVTIFVRDALSKVQSASVTPAAEAKS